MFGGGKRECGEREKRVRSGKEGFLRKETKRMEKWEGKEEGVWEEIERREKEMQKVER